MAVRNPGWYTLNATRAYPVDDRATQIDDNGQRMPSNILIDCRVKYPVLAGRYLFLGAVSVTPSLTTVILLAASDLAGSDATPIASLSVRRPVVPGRQYAMTAIYPGAGGWLAFGDGANGAVRYTGRFTSPNQSAIVARGYRAYEALPVPYVAKYGNAARLSGLVNLVGGDDVRIFRTFLRLHPDDASFSGDDNSDSDSVSDSFNFVTREVVLFALRDKTGSSERNVFSLYGGAIGARPTVDTCEFPTPVEWINGVGPDCCGDLYIEFRGCTRLSEITGGMLVDNEGDPVETVDMTGVVIDCNQDTDVTCGPAWIPADGVLPDAADDYCESISFSVSIESISYEPTPCVESVVIDIPLFLSGPVQFVIREGYFDYGPIRSDWWDGVEGAAPYENALVSRYPYSMAGDNVALANGDPGQIVDRKTWITLFQINQACPGALHNAAFLFRVTSAFPGVYEDENHLCSKLLGFAAGVSWDAHETGSKMLYIAAWESGRLGRLVHAAVDDLALTHPYKLVLHWEQGVLTVSLRDGITDDPIQSVATRLPARHPFCPPFFEWTSYGSYQQVGLLVQRSETEFFSFETIVG